jgi:hypothetical protein
MSGKKHAPKTRAIRITDPSKRRPWGVGLPPDYDPVR